MTVDGRVVAVSADLMDRSKLTAAFPEVEVVRLVASPTLDDAALVLVDLNLRSAFDVIALARQHDVPVYAYGSHVDASRILDATTAGAEAMPRSVFFRRLAEGTLLDERGRSAEG